MKRRTGSLALALIAATAALAAAPLASAWGARAAAADSERTVAEMLRYAIEDEYLARAEYAAILARQGQVMPFANIIRSEESHIAWLVEAFRSAGLPVPADRAADLAIPPVGLKASLEVGIQAEIDNIAMYDSFLSDPLMYESANASLRELLTRLRDASKNHLAAFKNNLAKL